MSVGTLYTISPSPRSQTVTGFVKYAGIPIEIHDTLPERVKGELCEEYTANFPLKRCPSFVSKDGSLKLTETIAILVHLANIGGDKAKKLLGEGEDYYRALQWISLSDCNAMPWAFRTCRMLGVFQGINLPYDKKTVDSNVKELDKLASMFETRLKTHTYLVTERPTISDFMAVYILSSAFKFIFGTNFRTAHPHFTRWFKTVSQHPFFEGAFDNFEYPDEMVNKN